MFEVRVSKRILSAQFANTTFHKPHRKIKIDSTYTTFKKQSATKGGTQNLRI